MELSTPEISESEPRAPTVSDGSRPADPEREAALARLAAKARLLERMLSGDERVLAGELRAELEALVGHRAEVVSLASARRRE